MYEFLLRLWSNQSFFERIARSILLISAGIVADSFPEAPRWVLPLLLGLAGMIHAGDKNMQSPSETDKHKGLQ